MLLGNFGNDSCRVYYNRLLRDGWKRVVRQEFPFKLEDHVFDKPVPEGWILRKTCSTKPRGIYWDQHELINRVTGKLLSLPTWEWADFHRGRMLWATEGKLFAAEINRQGLTNQVELYNFNDMEFEEIKAPY